MYIVKDFKRQRLNEYNLCSLNPSNPNANIFKLPYNWVHLVLVHGNTKGAVKLAALYKGYVTRRWYSHYRKQLKPKPRYWFC